jgi:Transcriptional regulators
MNVARPTCATLKRGTGHSYGGSMTDFVSVSAVVANSISDRILLEKRYAANQKLPNELELAEELGVSRTSIREAVKTLVARGLLRVERGRGTFVAAHPHSPDDPFGVSFLKDKKNLALNWFEMRLLLEPGIARLACERATPADIREIFQWLEETEALIRQGRDFGQADRRFHAAIVKAARNDVIERMLPAIETAIEDAVRISLHVKSQEKSRSNALTNHRLIAQFIEQKDGDGAHMAMYYHIKRGILDIQ